MQTVITLAEAKERGLTRYFTGKACAGGHVTERMVANRTCVICQQANTLATRERHPDNRRGQKQRHYAKHRAAILQKCTAWAAANPARAANYKRQHYLRSGDVVRERVKNWRQLNRDRKRATEMLREARKAGAPGAFSTADIAALLVSQKGQCNGCGCDITLRYSIDHIIPLSRPGTSNWPSNIQLLCSPCNSAKHDRTMEEWLALRSR